MTVATKNAHRALAFFLLVVVYSRSQTRTAKNSVEERDRRIAEKVDSAPQYFPSTFDGFERVWYHRQLSALEEPSLFETNELGATVYRLTWIPSFHHTVTARLELSQDGTAKLIVKQATGLGGYRAGQLAAEKSVDLTAEQVGRVQVLLVQINFWNRPDGMMNKNIGTDGSQWVLEGKDRGKYRIVEMWSPEGGPLVDLGNLLVKEIGGLNSKDVLSY